MREMLVQQPTYASKFSQVVGNGLDGAIRNAAALADIERLEVKKRQSHSDESLIRDVAGAQRQLFQMNQSLGNVDDSLVVDPIAKRHVQRSDSRSPFSQISHSDIGNVVARAQIQLAQRRHFGQVLEAAVADRQAETQVNWLEFLQPKGNVHQGVVSQFLTIL